MEPEIEIVECTVIKEAYLGTAYLLRDDQDPSREDWFPASQISFRRRNHHTGKATAEIRLWLLDKNGWNS